MHTGGYEPQRAVVHKPIRSTLWVWARDDPHVGAGTNRNRTFAIDVGVEVAAHRSMVLGSTESSGAVHGETDQGVERVVLTMPGHLRKREVVLSVKTRAHEQVVVRVGGRRVSEKTRSVPPCLDHHITRALVDKVGDATAHVRDDCVQTVCRTPGVAGCEARRNIETRIAAEVVRLRLRLRGRETKESDGENPHENGNLHAASCLSEFEPFLTQN